MQDRDTGDRRGPEGEPREEDVDRGHSRRRARERDRWRARKERVLHTRISEHLADDIRRMAEDLRVPVSNLVRNVLEEAFSVVERVTDNVGELIEDVIDEAEAARDRIHRRSRRKGRRREAPPPASPEPAEPSAATGSRERAEFSDVVGWQPVILNRTRSCVDCGTALDVGERAFVGLTQDGLSPHTLCRDCADERF